MAKARRSSRRTSASKQAGAGALRRAFLLVAVVLLFGAALYGLLNVDAEAPPRGKPAADSATPRAKPATDPAPPVDHIDASSRERLEQILREENGP